MARTLHIVPHFYTNTDISRNFKKAIVYIYIKEKIRYLTI